MKASNYNKIIKIELVLIIILLIVYFVIDFNDRKVKNLELEMQDLQIELHKTKKELDDTKNDLETLNLKIQNLKISLVNDMASMMHLSSEQQSLILDEIWKQSKKYKINPAFLYTILWKESRFRNDVIHKPTYVRTLKKEVQALGMGGIVWDFWGDKLKANTSLKSKKDLKKWEKNIEATAYILSYLKSLPKVSNTKNKYESAASRYYGKYQANYVNKTMSKFTELTS